jgi:subfamily B ATP-binding cassette protein MsbA
MNNIIAVLQFGWTYLRRYKSRLAASVLFALIFAFTNSSFIGATKILADRLGGKPATEAKKDPAKEENVTPLRKSIDRAGVRVREWLEPWLPRVGQPMDRRQLVGLLLFLPFLVAVRAISDYLSSYCMGWVSERTVRDLRVDIMDKLQSLSLDYFNRSSTGDVLTRVNTDSLHLLRTLRQGAGDLIKEPLTVVTVFAWLCWLDWQLTLTALILLPLCLYPLVRLGKKAKKATKAGLKASIMQSGQLVEMLAGVRVVKAFGLEEEQMARFRKTSSQIVHAGMKGVQAKEMVNPVIEVFAVLGLGALLIYVFQTGRSGSDLASFLIGILLFFQPIKKLAGLHVMFEQTSVGVGRLREILQEQPSVREPAHPKPLSAFKSEIVFDHVSMGYDGRGVLKDFSLTIPRGFKLGVAGESGSGKTTMLNLLFRFYDVTRGSIHIDGIDIREVSTRDLRQIMALVSQEVVIFDSSIAENIACGKKGATREEVIAAAKAAYAHEFIEDRPGGYDGPAGERGSTLSGGQRQRLSIARAFIRNAPILVLDEATGSLDAMAEAEVQAAIDNLAEHRTVICVAHRLSTLASMDKIIVLSDGVMVESGTFEELLRKGGVFTQMAAGQGLRPLTLKHG